MSIFPDKPYDGQQVVEEIGNEQVRIWTYSQAENEWTYKEYGGTGSVVYTDQVLDRQSLATQTTVNLATAATASATQQNVDEIQGTKSKGTWQFHGGPLPDDGVPAVNQFWLADKEDQRTQEFCQAAFVRIHALGNQGQVTRDRVELGRAVVGDKLIIQNLADTDGCSYTITSVEEHGPVDGDYAKSYALYGVEPDPLYCIGSVSPAEIVSIKLKSAPTEGGGGGDFLPLSGGSITGSLSVAGSLSNQGGIMLAGPKDKGFYVYDLQGGAVFSAYGDKFGAGVQYFGAVDQPKHVVTKEYADSTYLGLAGGTSSKMQGILYMGGHKICGVTDPERSDDAATRGFVEEQIAAIDAPETSLSTKDKLYLQGFYPFRLGESTQISNPGEFLVKDSSYLVTQNPEKWKYFYFSTTDAYGQDLAGKFLNHMHMESQHEGQIWICKENGYKFCGYIGGMKVKDQNFEQYFNLEMDNSVELLNPPHYDTQGLRVDKGEVLWIKCSFWGN